MDLTLSLSDDLAQALGRRARAEHRTVHQVALAAIDAYTRQPSPQPRQAIPSSELIRAFADLPRGDSATERAGQDRHIEPGENFDAYERARRQPGPADTPTPCPAPPG